MLDSLDSVDSLYVIVLFPDQVVVSHRITRAGLQTGRSQSEEKQSSSPSLPNLCRTFTLSHLVP